MTSIFDGLAGILSDPAIFGAPVTYRPQGGSARVVDSVFRRTPIEAEDSLGRAVLTVAPTWRVRHDLVPEVSRGDQIDPGDGNLYEICNVQPTGSPAADAFVLCELYEVAP